MHEVPPLLRQWMLLRMLSARRHGATVRELAVNSKTIRRDLQTLRQVGFPLEKEIRDHGRKHWRGSGEPESLREEVVEQTEKVVESVRPGW